MSYFYPQSSMTLGVLWEDFSFTSDATLQKTYSLPIMLKSVQIHINDYTSADTFNAEIDYKNFPFDPRTIRACRVTIHMANVGKIFNGDNSLHALERTVENTIFQGFVDEESISFDDDKRTVKLEGRDLTALLIDRHYTQGTIPLTGTIDQVIKNLLNELDETRQTATSPGLQLEIRGLSAADLPVLSSFMQSDGDHNLSGAKSVDRHETYWEAIQDICSRAGLVAYVELDKLILTKPRVLYDITLQKPRQFIYGSNIKNLTMKRKLGRKKTFNVIVRSLIGKQVVEAKIPLEATAEWSKATGITAAEVKIPEVGPKGESVEMAKWKPAPYMSFAIPDCDNKDHLIRIAESIYEEVGRQQLEGSFETRDMEVLKGIKDALPDSILNLRNGTPVQILINQGDLHGISKLASVASRKEYLIARGYEPSIAKAFANSIDHFVNVFYTKAVSFSLDIDNGFKATVEYLNFIDTKKAESTK